MFDYYKERENVWKRLQKSAVWQYVQKKGNGLV